MTENVELFELYAGKTLGMLYKRFPLPTEITVERLVERVPVSPTLSEHMRREIAGHTLKWLERSGYIEPTTLDAIGPFRGTLTARGFQCLSALPKALQPVADVAASTNETLGDKLAEAAAEGVSEAGREAVKDAVKETLSWGLALAVSTAAKVMVGG